MAILEDEYVKKLAEMDLGAHRASASPIIKQLATEVRVLRRVAAACGPEYEPHPEALGEVLAEYEALKKGD